MIINRGTFLMTMLLCGWLSNPWAEIWNVEIEPTKNKNESQNTYPDRNKLPDSFTKGDA